MRTPVLVLAAATLLAGGCTSVVAGDSTPPQTATVGTQALTWSESTYDGVAEYADAHPEPVLLRTDDEWQTWVAGLPDDVLEDDQDAASALDLDDAVAIAGTYSSCMEQSQITDHGDGQVAFEVFVAPEDQGTDCAWSPYRIDVWLIPLEDLGVSTPDNVTLVS